MSYNGSGVFVINTAGQPVVSGTVISSTAFNALTADLATGLSTALTKDGQTTPTANIKLGGYKITGLGTGTVATDAANVAQVQNGSTSYLTVSGTNTITGSLIPALTAYTAGATYYFVAAGANTGAVTINIDGLGAKDIKVNGTTALASGDIVSGQVVAITYDGTQFQYVNRPFNTSVAGTANGVAYFNGSGALSSGSGITYDGTNFALTGGAVIGSPTGGNKGAGTLNATALYVNGSSIVSGAMTLISTLTASSSASFEWTGLSGYDKYLVIFDGIAATNSVTMQMQVGTGSGPTYLTSNYSCSYFAIDSAGVTSAISSVLGSVPLSQFTIINSGTSGRFNGFIEIGGMINGADASAWWHTLFVNNTLGNTGSCNGRTFFPISNTTAKTAIKIYMSSGNITSGKATLYGLSQ